MNVGLPFLECRDTDDWRTGDHLEVEMGSAGVINIAGAEGEALTITPIPPFMQELIADGGLMKHIMKKQAKGA